MKYWLFPPDKNEKREMTERQKSVCKTKDFTRRTKRNKAASLCALEGCAGYDSTLVG